MNPGVNAFQRHFVNEVLRCDEMDRRLRYIESELYKENIKMPELRGLPYAPNQREMIYMEAMFEKAEKEVLELSQISITLKTKLQELLEMKHVLEKTQFFFEGQDDTASYVEDVRSMKPRDRLDFVAGVIGRNRLASFERMLWRLSCGGNVYLREADIETKLEDPITGKSLYKTVFVAFFQGEQLLMRITKVCKAFRATLHPCPKTHDDRDDMLRTVRARIEDMRHILNQTQDHRQCVLRSVARDLPKWIVWVQKMKAIYHTMNLFSMQKSEHCLVGEGWVPVHDLYKVQRALNIGSQAEGSAVKSFLNFVPNAQNPPTFNRTNKFTQGFQNLIDAYGIASYRELNPALYTIVTFPFLFGVMFGDIGHGIIMTAFALWMVLYEKNLKAKKIKNEIFTIFFGGRYIILMMGLFSCYIGFIYNDVFSKSMNIFGSAWKINWDDKYLNDDMTTLNPSTDVLMATPYLMGLDPVWQLSTNKIIFLNSYKMKLSIIFGVIHMIFGVCMSVVNMVHFRRKIHILLVFLPQILFLVLLFAYMCFMMFLKWMLYSAYTKEQIFSPGCAPSVLILFINMMLLKDGNPLPGCNEFMFDGQRTIQIVLLAISVVCIPWMLLAKPLYIMRTKNKVIKLSSKTTIIIIRVSYLFDLI